MSAPCDTYAAAKLISQCAPISYYMTRDDIMKFTLVTPVADVTRVMAKVRHRYFPILDADGKYCGMISRRNIINLRKRRIILVDHNEATQAVEGFDQPRFWRSSTPPHRQSGDQRPGVLPQPAGGLHRHHRHPDVR